MVQKNDKGDVLCPKCGKYYFPKYEEKTIEKYGCCGDCFSEAQDLIKVNNHYVPWSYRRYVEAGEIIEDESEYCEDKNASLPMISWDEKYKKWKVAFDGPDTGGYDSQPFAWYFNTKEEIFEAMLKK